MENHVENEVKSFKSVQEVHDYIIDKLDYAKPTWDGGFQACCPAHEDSNPSLSIRLSEDDKILLHCHAGCETEDIVKALGIRMSDLFPKKGNNETSGVKKKIIATYPYFDSQDNLLYQVVRTEPKGFFQRRPDGKGGWINKIEGVPRVLYRQNEVIKTIKEDQTIFITEGEKDVHNMLRHNLMVKPPN